MKPFVRPIQPGSTTDPRAEEAGDPANVVVVGSTATALVVSAAAEAGLLRRDGRGVLQNDIIVRAGTWDEAEAICARSDGCVVVGDAPDGLRALQFLQLEPSLVAVENLPGGAKHLRAPATGRE